jgi:uncharacterized protein YbjT (DUF2867 family)
MNVLILGATGMVGQGVLRECLLAPDVGRVVALGRSSTGQHHEKLVDLVRADLMNVAGYEPELDRFDACFFCLGVSSAGMTEERYSRVTYDLTLAVATALAKRNASMTFIYVSGQGTDSTERGRSMWARVKGRTENALLKLPFKAYMFRPGLIVPMHGIRSRTGWYNAIYAVIAPLVPLLRKVFPSSITTTEQMGRAMLAVARNGYPKRILEARDIVTF